MVDYEFYKNTFGGSADEDAFNAMLPRAVAKVNYLTFDHIIENNGEYGQMVIREFRAFTTAEFTAVKMGICALVDEMVTMDSVKASMKDRIAKGNYQSLSSGGESIAYGIASTVYDSALTDKSIENDIYRSALKEYMRPSLFEYNPFYAGAF